MSDPLESFEAELSRMQPRAVPPELMQRIGSRLAGKVVPPHSDAMLLSAICSGALAACMIVVLLLGEARGTEPSAPPMLATSDSARLMDFRLAVARVDSVRTDVLK